ncbi:hypothetical protein Tco_0434944 [Tanacetum coccineum]
MIIFIPIKWLGSRRKRPCLTNGHGDKAKKKELASSIPSASSETGIDEALTKLLVNEYATHTDSFLTMKRSDREIFLELKRQEIKA